MRLSAQVGQPAAYLDGPINLGGLHVAAGVEGAADALHDVDEDLVAPAPICAGCVQDRLNDPGGPLAHLAEDVAAVHLALQRRDSEVVAGRGAGARGARVEQWG